MATRVMDGERFDAGRSVGRAAQAIRNNLWLLAGLAVALTFIPSLLVQSLLPQAYSGIAPPGATNFSSFGFRAVGIGGVIGMLLYAVSLGAMTHVALAGMAGSPADFRAAVIQGVRRALPMFGLFIVMYVAIGFGFLFLIVPGLMLLTMWSVAVPALVGERLGVFASLGRSRSLTKGSRWAVFGLLLALLVAYMLIFGLATVMAGGFEPTTLAAKLNSLSVTGITYRIGSLVVSTVATVLIAAIFFELRYIHEGAGPDGLAAIFD